MHYERKVFERYLTEAEERSLFATLARVAGPLAARDHAWMRLLRYTGIRVGALAGLTVADARSALKEGHLRLRAEINKGGRPHKIYLCRAARSALQDLLKTARAQGYTESPDRPLVMSRNHRGMSVRSFQDRMRRWVAEAGLSVEASPHWFRHTLAKRLMQRSTAREPLAIVGTALGHASLASTAVYVLPDREEMELAMEEAG